MTTQVPNMSEQSAAQSVIAELLRLQLTVAPRSRFARLWGVSPLGIDSIAWYLGAQGEIIVGKTLTLLPSNWRVFHALPVGTSGADIDHLVLGPGGIFTINTKHHRGKKIWVAGSSFLVNGRKQAYIRNAQFEAARVTRTLRAFLPQIPPVHPLITLVRPSSITIKKKPDEVTVVNARELCRWLLSRPVSLAEHDLIALEAIIDSPLTWPVPTSLHNPDQMAQFSRLDADVRTARMRRTVRKMLSVTTLSMAALFVVLPRYLEFVAAGFVAP